MNTKQRIVSLIIAIMGIVLISSTALAGSKQRHRWEGVAIGLGAAILGHAIFQAHTGHHGPAPAYANPEPYRRHGHGPDCRQGHWEWRKTWVPPTFERVWNPGHYNRRGQWVHGHWIDVKSEAGRWTQERVWVAHR